MHDQELAGQVVGHYRILHKQAEGGMATIYLAQDLHLQRQVAIKVFRPQSEHSTEFLRRFTREAQVLANLDHPHILPVHDYGEQEDFAYLVMPFLTRGSLKERLVSGPALLLEEALQLIEQVLLALQYAHEQGLVHRDIKPANLLFKADGSLLLSNFSLSQMPFAEDTLSNLQETPTETSDPFSTLLGASAPHYMAPEQLEGQATPQSDLYSIGVVLYELLTGSRPFVANSLPGLHLKHLTEQPPAPRELNPQISPELEVVVLRALAKDPRQRFQSAGDFLQALRTSRGSTGNGDNLPEVNGERPPRTLLPLQEPHSSVQQQMLEIQTPEPRIVKVRAGQSRDSIRWMVPLGLLLALVIILASARALVSSRTQTLVPQKGNAVPHSTPGNTITVPSVSHPTLLTNCPQRGTARRAVLDASPSSVQNNHQNLVYLAYGEASTELERYDVVTKKTSLILASPGYIRSAQISADGHWILFARTQTSGFALQLVRTDGQALQTLYCTTENIETLLWSPDGERLIFDVSTQHGAACSSCTFFLQTLNITTGKLQTVMQTTADKGLVPVIWSRQQKNMVYLTDYNYGLVAVKSLGSLYLLDTDTQKPPVLIFRATTGCEHYAVTPDGAQLFISQCHDGVTSDGAIGPSSIQAMSDPTNPAILNPIYTGPLAIQSMAMASQQTLLLEVQVSRNTHEIWKINIDGSGLQLLTPNSQTDILLGLSGNGSGTQDTWEMVSRDGKFYCALLWDDNGSNRSLGYASLNGGLPEAIPGASEAIGWITV